MKTKLHSYYICDSGQVQSMYTLWLVAQYLGEYGTFYWSVTDVGGPKATVGSATPRLVVLGVVRKEAKQTMKSKLGREQCLTFCFCFGSWF